MTNENRPLVGVATVVVKDGKILLGRDIRKGDVYAVPGGHWENGETLKECAKREVMEESGIICSEPTLISVYDFYRKDKERSYVAIGVKADYLSGEFVNNDEEGRKDWAWYDPNEALTLNLFAPDKILIERYLSGIIYE